MTVVTALIDTGADFNIMHPDVVAQFEEKKPALSLSRHPYSSALHGEQRKLHKR